jgi:20S proteasome alpha/beta subunit
LTSLAAWYIARGASAGRKCVAVAVDRRFGRGNELVSDDARRVLKLHARLLCAFTGLTTDVQTLMQVCACSSSGNQSCTYGVSPLWVRVD